MDFSQTLDSKTYDQAQQIYGIIWSQNVHFVTTSSFNGNGSHVSSRARFFLSPLKLNDRSDGDKIRTQFFILDALKSFL